MLHHRPVNPKDLATICSFAQSPEELFFCYPKANYPLTEEQLALAIDNRTHSTVIEKNNEIAGFANFVQWQQNGCCKIGNMIVNPKLRKQGIASHLIKVMIEQARKSFEASEIHISCFNENAIALLLYKKLGFTPFDIQQRQNKQSQTVALIHFYYKLTYIL